MGSGAQLSMGFILIDVRQELVEQLIGAFQLKDVVGS
jgi:hypothetical protein